MQVKSCNYYAYKRGQTYRENSLTGKIKECFNSNARRYGSRRIAVALKIGRNTVRKALKSEGLRAIQPKSFKPKTTDSEHGLGFNENLLKAAAIIHSDRGSQYAANAFRSLLQRNCFRQSMSGKDNCYDNAQAESFFSRFKAELLENGVFENVEQAKSEVFSYIEGYYNRVRLHSSLGYKSPMEFEAELKIKNSGGRESFVSI